MTTARLFRVTGLVQGVGFRPTVHRIARELALAGEVFNDAEGVGVILEGPEEAVLRFPEVLRAQKPPLARIDDVVMTEVPATGRTEFTITKTKGGRVRTGITADAATCAACLEDLFDPANRRYRYAFTNCTHCGPRFTITKRLPYDRPQTTMAPFAMCPDCLTEYEDPLDRRFHAQPNACPVCGPKLELTLPDRTPLLGDPVREAVRAIRDGKILAVKGLGGFHLACDARNPEAVARLRARKRRDEKAFALMAQSVASARRIALVTPEEKELLESVARPIVLLRKRPGAELVGIAPGLADVGVMLPYTPLHWLLFHTLEGEPSGTAWCSEASDALLVMTSANPSGEPLVIDNDEAYDRLGDLADLFFASQPRHSDPLRRLGRAARRGKDALRAPRPRLRPRSDRAPARDALDCGDGPLPQEPGCPHPREGTLSHAAQRRPRRDGHAPGARGFDRPPRGSLRNHAPSLRVRHASGLSVDDARRNAREARRGCALSRSAPRRARRGRDGGIGRVGGRRARTRRHGPGRRPNNLGRRTSARDAPGLDAARYLESY